MEKWVNFLIVNVVLVIVLGLLTNLATAGVKFTFERSVFSSRKKRRERLIKDYLFIKMCTKDSIFLLSHSITWLANLIVRAITAILVTHIPHYPSSNYSLDEIFYFKRLVREET